MLCSGSALPYIYQYFLSKGKYKSCEKIQEKEAKIKNKDQDEKGNLHEMNGTDIVFAALNHHCELCRTVVNKWIEFLAMSCTQYAQVTIPYGGIVQVQNICKSLIPIFKENEGDWEKNLFLVNQIIVIKIVNLFKRFTLEQRSFGKMSNIYLQP